MRGVIQFQPMRHGTLLLVILQHTYYKLAVEDEHSGPRTTDIFTPAGDLIATVRPGFAFDLSLEGSGKLSDGRIVNYSAVCSHGTPGYHGVTSCYRVLDAQQYPWGRGHGVPVEPLRSVAVDSSVIPYGTTVYIHEFDGLQIPLISGAGGFTHDGLFRAEDSGGGIRGNHIDIYAGPTAMYRWLEARIPTSYPHGTGLHAELLPASAAPPRFASRGAGGFLLYASMAAGAYVLYEVWKSRRRAIAR